MMRAVVHDRYGGPEVLRVTEVPDPEPADDEVLVRVHATTVNRTDCGFRRPDPFWLRPIAGLRRPKHRILGSEFAGVVEAVGARVRTFAVGDRVFGVSSDRFGANAELVAVREHGSIATMPDGSSFVDAAAVCDGVVLAHTCLTKAGVGPGQRVLVYGASGSIGSAGVQLAVDQGAHVTAVCDARNLDVVRSLGPDEVIDYTTEDFAGRGDTYDVVFDAVGKTSFARCRRILARRGQFVTTDFGPKASSFLLALLTRPTSWLGTRRVRMPVPRYAAHHVLHVKELLEAGRYRAVVDRTYPLEAAVEATRYVETGRKTGNVVLIVAPAAAT